MSQTNQQLLTEEVVDKWDPIVEDSDLTEHASKHERDNLIRILETTSNVLQEETATGDVANWDPVLIPMISRTQPSLISNAFMGTQPMNMPTGLIFVQKVWYEEGFNGSRLNEAWNQLAPDPTHSGRMSTADGEDLAQREEVTTDAADTGTTAYPVQQVNPWKEMAFSIEKETVTAETRALKARYTRELEQDLRKVHGKDAGAEIVNILRGEIIAEQDREAVENLRTMAVFAGTFDLDTDTDGRWEIEKYQALALKIEKEANKIALGTRRGKGNIILTSSNVAGGLAMAGKVNSNVQLGDIFPNNAIGPHFVGVFAGRYPMYVDPYLFQDEVLIGYKGPNQYDNGYFTAPYIGLELHRAKGEEDFHPRVGFKTRYGLLENPFGIIVPPDDTTTVPGDDGGTNNFDAGLMQRQGTTTGNLIRNTVPNMNFLNFVGFLNEGETRYANQYYRRFLVTGGGLG